MPSKKRRAGPAAPTPLPRSAPSGNPAAAFDNALAILRDHLQRRHRTEVDEELAVADHLRRNDWGRNDAVVEARRIRAQIDAAIPQLVLELASAADALAVAAESFGLDSRCADAFALRLREVSRSAVAHVVEKHASDVSVLARQVGRRTTRAAETTESIGIRGAGGLADWAPTAHQELVIDVLQRDGRLRTGVLWERVAPKHVNLRAHQNAMRDLVVRGRVRTDGKGRATEYWLP